MPIRLITGLPGDGKTLLMMSELREAARRADRPLFQAGIDGLVAGYAERIDNARDWNAIAPGVEGICTCGHRDPHAHVVPDGSLIFVDEAWKWFGHLHDARGQQTPPAVLQLAEHRHRGIDFVWTTQSPSQIYPFARALIGDHSHVVRIFGTRNAKVYTWGELNDDVKSRAMRDAAISKVFRYDPSLFELYQSATLHTIKRRLPKKLLWIPVAVALACLGIYTGLHALKPKPIEKPAQVTQTAADAPGASPPAPKPEKDKQKWPTLKDYVRDHTPRMAAKPWTAPIYDDRQPTTDPRLLCVISGVGKGSTCHCYTEQATPYYSDLTDQQCRLFAVQGVYDPYIQPSQSNQWSSGQQRDQQAQLGQTADTATDGKHAPAGEKFGAVTHYGQIHTEAAATDNGYRLSHF